MKEELLNLRMKESGNLMEHLCTYNRSIVDLQKVDVVYSTEDEALMLLASLPPSYEHFRATLMIKKITLNFEEVVQDLAHHRLAQSFGDNSQGARILTWTEEKREPFKQAKSKKGNGRNPKFKDNEGCFKCEFTHYWKQIFPI
ncbi:PREDICTED: Retrovirus-related Pol poly from transposon TNT [Prunus dulcis]|uniref:PREDICTED: Retrovirus-related Pol poly from transposon TNT n=1 Tax=Prunus dulcis TaxID=3755 RepID=A0A5E4GPX1_PRUDU|nr:PREDICTED: Retrovirus-related Pol poly from transposon TNT [Prunus dulcis]